MKPPEVLQRVAKLECKVCMIKHDIEVHRATVSVHRWLRLRLLRALEPPPTPTKPSAALPTKNMYGKTTRVSADLR